MSVKIRIKNLNKKRGINHKNIEKIVLLVTKSFKKVDAIIDITFVSNIRIKLLNKKYMAKDRATDVISFSLKENSFPVKKRIIGDIYISSDMAYRNARRFNTGYKKELALYVIHGLLHILGFGDKTKKERKKIRSLEEKFLSKVRKYI